MESLANSTVQPAMIQSEVALAEMDELIIQTGDLGFVDLTLIEGRAEIFGFELIQGQAYRVPKAANMSIFTYDGCAVQMNGKSFNTSLSNGRRMADYLQMHKRLHALRTEALANQTSGPRVLIIGPTDSGKSTLAKVLLNYAVREGMYPTFIDLDVGQNGISIPGTISASVICQTIDPSKGMLQFNPVSLFYGHESPGANMTNYKHQTSLIGEIMDEILNTEPSLVASGFVINTCGWIQGPGYELIKYAALAMRVTHIIAFEDAELRETMASDRDLKASNIEIINATRSSNVFTRDQLYRRTARSSKVSEYFNGFDGNDTPTIVTISYRKMDIIRVGPNPRTPPNSAYAPIRPTELSREPLHPGLVNSVLGISAASNVRDVNALYVLGYVKILGVNMRENTVTLLKSGAEPLSSMLFIIGSLFHLP